MSDPDSSGHDVGDDESEPAPDRAANVGDQVTLERTARENRLKRRFDGLSQRGRDLAAQANEKAEALRARSKLVDVGFRVYDRDRDAAGTLLGSAMALRLFLFFVPMILLMVGLAGLIGHHFGYDSLASDARIGGSIGGQIDSAFSQGSTAAWFACGAGLIGMATTGWSLSKALIVSSALGWRLGGRQKTAVRVVGILVGLIVGIGLTAVIVNRIRDASGVALASVSFVAVFGVYIVLWLLVFQTLPRATTDPGASIPGALVTSAALTGMQAISVLYLPGAIERSSELYGAIGITLATLGWFFILGRTISFSFSLNAVIFERVGSLSELIFSLPGVRWIPRRYNSVARYFDLAHAVADSDDDTPDDNPDEVGPRLPRL
jgi:uncharacterized BrkB/YihY/UPF0761 family membrane protein